MKVNADEKELLVSAERGECGSPQGAASVSGLATCVARRPRSAETGG
jgi:hypothetical protein